MAESRKKWRFPTSNSLYLKTGAKCYYQSAYVYKN